MIAIKNMEMPKNCIVCPFCERMGSQLHCPVAKSHIDIRCTDARHPDCPLIEIEQSAIDRYKDLQDYFGENAKNILESQEEFKKWLDRNLWHVRKVDELARKLEQLEQSEDCVSRQAVLDLAETIQTDDYSGNEILDVVNVEDIKALPPVTPTQSWIPVNEELPKENGEYMITWITSCLKGGKHRFTGTSEYEVTNEYDYENNRFKGEWLLEDYVKSYYPDVKVIAWQPLPKAYEEKRGDEE